MRTRSPTTYNISLIRTRKLKLQARSAGQSRLPFQTFLHHPVMASETLCSHTNQHGRAIIPIADRRHVNKQTTSLSPRYRSCPHKRPFNCIFSPSQTSSRDCTLTEGRVRVHLQIRGSSWDLKSEWSFLEVHTGEQSPRIQKIYIAPSRPVPRFR